MFCVFVLVVCVFCLQVIACAVCVRVSVSVRACVCACVLACVLVIVFNLHSGHENFPRVSQTDEIAMPYQTALKGMQMEGLPMRLCRRITNS